MASNLTWSLSIPLATKGKSRALDVENSLKNIQTTGHGHSHPPFNI